MNDAGLAPRAAQDARNGHELNSGKPEPDCARCRAKFRVSVLLDGAASGALARVIRSVRPEDYGVDPAAWYRALDEISAQLGAGCPRMPR